MCRRLRGAPYDLPFYRLREEACYKRERKKLKKEKKKDEGMPSSLPCVLLLLAWILADLGSTVDDEGGDAISVPCAPVMAPHPVRWGEG
jgi:hypothetical protein